MYLPYLLCMCVHVCGAKFVPDQKVEAVTERSIIPKISSLPWQPNIHYAQCHILILIHSPYESMHTFTNTLHVEILGTITRFLSLVLSVWGALRNPVLHDSSCFILHLPNVPVYKPQSGHYNQTALCTSPRQVASGSSTSARVMT